VNVKIGTLGDEGEGFGSYEKNGENTGDKLVSWDYTEAIADFSVCSYNVYFYFSGDLLFVSDGDDRENDAAYAGEGPSGFFRD